MIDRWLSVHSLRCPLCLYRNNTAADASYPVVRRPLGLRLVLERYQKYTRYPIPNSIAFADADTQYRYPIVLGMLNDYRIFNYQIKCSY